MIAKFIRGIIAFSIVLTFSPMSYAADKDELQLSLHNAVLDCDLKGVLKSLQAHADPDFVPIKRSVTDLSCARTQNWPIHPHCIKDAGLCIVRQMGLFAMAASFCSAPAIFLGYIPLTLMNAGCLCKQAADFQDLLDDHQLDPRQNEETLTPLLLIATNTTHYGKSWKDEEAIAAVKALINARADIDATDAFGNSAIMHVVHAVLRKTSSEKEQGILDLLLKANADLTLKNDFGLGLDHNAGWEELKAKRREFLY